MFMRESFGLSIRRSCILVDVQRTTFAYLPHKRDEGPLRQRLRELEYLGDGVNL
jgi:hypothetical protein